MGKKNQVVTEQLASLTTAMLTALTTAAIEALGTDQIGEITTDQAAALSTESISVLPTCDLSAISTAEPLALTTAAIEALGTEDAVDAGPAMLVLVKNHGINTDGRKCEFFAAGLELHPIKDADLAARLVRSGAQVEPK